MKNNKNRLNRNTKNDISRGSTASAKRMERETGFEPATSSLGRRHATAALLPLVTLNITNSNRFGNMTFNESPRNANISRKWIWASPAWDLLSSSMMVSREPINKNLRLSQFPVIGDLDIIPKILAKPVDCYPGNIPLEHNIWKKSPEIMKNQISTGILLHGFICIRDL